jgi:hypothetical protein
LCVRHIDASGFVYDTWMHQACVYDTWMHQACVYGTWMHQACVYGTWMHQACVYDTWMHQACVYDTWMLYDTWMHQALCVRHIDASGFSRCVSRSRLPHSSFITVSRRWQRRAWKPGRWRVSARQRRTRRRRRRRRRVRCVHSSSSSACPTTPLAWQCGSMERIVGTLTPSQSSLRFQPTTYVVN